MKKLIINILLIILTFSCVDASNIYYSKKDFLKCKVVYGLAVKNNDNHSVKDILVYIPKITDSLPHQTVKIKSINPCSYKEENTSLGTAVLVFSVSKINPNQELRFLVTAETITWHIKFNISKKLNVFNVKETLTKKFINSQEHFIIRNKSLSRKCDEFLNENDLLERAFNIYNYIISGSFSFSDSLDIKDINVAYEKKHLQCSEAAALYVAMTRYCNVPSRYVGGILFFASKNWYPLIHAWAEIYIYPYGWLPVDPTLGRLSREHREFCFAEQRNRYITLWKTEYNPFFISVSSERDSRSLKLKNCIYVRRINQ